MIPYQRNSMVVLQELSDDDDQCHGNQRGEDWVEVARGKISWSVRGNRLGRIMLPVEGKQNAIKNRRTVEKWFASN